MWRRIMLRKLAVLGLVLVGVAGMWLARGRRAPQLSEALFGPLPVQHSTQEAIWVDPKPPTPMPGGKGTFHIVAATKAEVSFGAVNEKRDRVVFRIDHVDGLTSQYELAGDTIILYPNTTVQVTVSPKAGNLADQESLRVTTKTGYGRNRLTHKEAWDQTMILFYPLK